MIAILTFSIIAALLVLVAGRSDKARDPRLTVLALGLMALFPLLWLLLPKAEVVPVAQSPEVSEGASGVDVMKWLGMLWALASGVAVTRLILAARGLAKWHRDSMAIGVEEGIELRVLRNLRSPVATGVFRKVIFVPASWSLWSHETRRVVLAHELAHHRRRDPLWRWIAEIACAVNPWNPLAIWMARRLALQCEHACDAAVLSEGVPADRYAKLLCDFAEPRPAALALGVSVTSTLEARVRRVMQRATSRQGSAGVMLLIGLAIALAGTLAVIGPVREQPVSKREVEMRFSAQAFPGADDGELQPLRFAEKP